MPVTDPLRARVIKRRFVRIMRVAAVFAIIIAAVAVLLVARGQSELRIDMLIAAALGIGLTVLLGTALMTLNFLSSRSGHHSDASAAQPESDQE